MSGAPEDIAAPILPSEFAAVDLRKGTVLSAEPMQNARTPAYVLTVDFGPLGRWKSTAQLTVDHTADELIGQSVVAVINLPPKQVGNHTSRCLILGATYGQHVGLLTTPKRVPDGARIH